MNTKASGRSYWKLETRVEAIPIADSCRVEPTL